MAEGLIVKRTLQLYSIPFFASFEFQTKGMYYLFKKKDIKCILRRGEYANLCIHGHPYFPGEEPYFLSDFSRFPNLERFRKHFTR